jgi:putative hydroxymethylpyrimidine transport system permease protein
VLRRYGPPAALLALAIALWQLVASLPGVDDLVLASPVEVARALVEDASLLVDDTGVTLLEAGLGLLVAVAIGAATAVTMHLVRPIGQAAVPLLVASQAIPIPILAPLFVLAFDYGIGPKVAIVALIAFFPIAVGMVFGLRSVDPQALNLMRSFGAPRRRILWKVELPAAMPAFFVGARLGATVTVIGAVFGEWAGAEQGLGRAVLNGITQLQTPRVYAEVVLLTVMAIALYGLVALVERAAVPWARREAPA